MPRPTSSRLDFPPSLAGEGRVGAVTYDLWFEACARRFARCASGRARPGRGRPPACRVGASRYPPAAAVPPAAAAGSPKARRCRNGRRPESGCGCFRSPRKSRRVSARTRSVPRFARRSPAGRTVRTRPWCLRGRLAPVEATTGRADLQVPSERAQLRLELVGLIEDLDRAEPPAVFQLAEDGLPLESLFHTTSLLRAEFVDEEDPAVRGERVTNDPPECGESVLGYMRKPEGEEHEVVAPIRSQREDVGQNVAHIGSVDPLSIERQHLLRSVDRSHVPGMLGEPLRPPSGAAR